MENPENKSHSKIQQMNSSVAAFRELIETLRNKNRKSPENGPALSEPNPQSCLSNQSQAYASEGQAPYFSKPNHHSFNQAQTAIIFNQSAPHIGEDQVIKIKPRGFVAGRDILNKKPAQLPSSKFSRTVPNFNNIQKLRQIEKNEAKLAHRISATEQEPKRIQIAAVSSAANNEFISAFNSQTKATKLGLNQKKLNSALATNKKIKDIDEQVIIHFYGNSYGLSQQSHPDEIFDFFERLLDEIGVIVASPFIKKFKNCVYFGNPIEKDQKYEGFLYFYDRKFYYGEFMNSQKHGCGVEILFDFNIIFKGLFNEGQKTGKFWVKKPSEQYTGLLSKGLYHGKGKLQSSDSIYEGQFWQGLKHGFGEQLYPKTGLKFTGYFHKGTFTKRSKSNCERQQIQKGIVFKNSAKGSRKSFKKFNNTGLQPHSQIIKNEDYNIPPFTTSRQVNFERKQPFNLEKIKQYRPEVKYVEPMPENCRDFDYSFDVSSKRESQIARFAHHTHRNKKEHEFRQFPRIEEENLDNSSYEQPLPVPCFYRKY